MKICITGGVGSGKSTFTKLLSEYLPNYKNVSVDYLVSECYNDIEIRKSLVSLYSTADKIELSTLAFSNPEIRKNIESLFMKQVVTKLREVLFSSENVIVEFPLLSEHGTDIQDEFDRIYLVTASSPVRKERFMGRDGATEEKFNQILAIQDNDAERKSKLNITSVILNSGSYTNLVATASYVSDQVKVVDQVCKEARIKHDEKIGIVSGSFDPITLGHSWLIEKALSVVDTVIVAVAFNPSKTYLFDDRVKLVKESLNGTLTRDQRKRVKVTIIPHNEVLADYAKAVGAKFIFRGLRNASDLEYENTINLVQRKLAPEIETLYFITPRELIEVSSTFIKSLLHLDRGIDIAKPYVSETVLEALKGKTK